MPLFATLLVLSLSCSAFADATTPAPSQPAVVSPRGTFRVEQACNERPGSGLDVCEVWLVSIREPGRRAQLPEPDDDNVVRAGYKSDLRVSPDERYILREQKLCTGAAAAYLYEPVGELDYRLTANPEVSTAAKGLFVRQAGVRDDEGMGIVELDAWSGDGKSLVVTLRGRDVAGHDVRDWRCTIDIGSGRAYVTGAQVKANARTFSRRSSRH
jgi:hypothetical protein